MRNYQTDPVSVSEVEGALARAIESAEWATQKDDAIALGHLKTFLKSSNTTCMFYLHLMAMQPGNIKEDDSLTGISKDILALLYEKAFHGGPAKSVVNVEYKGPSGRGSAKYMITTNKHQRITLFIRDCRGELRGEVNEDNFTIIRASQPVHETKGIGSFFKKVWNNL